MSIDFRSEEFLMAAIAFLIAHRREPGYRQVEIAEDLKVKFSEAPDLKQSNVSKLIKKAIEEKYLVKAFAVGPKIPEHIRRYVDETFQSDPELQKHIDAKCPKPIRCRIHICGGAIEEYPSEAAWKLTKILEPAKLVAVSWGRTLADVLKALDTLSFAPNWSFDAFPIVGQPLHLRKGQVETRFDAFHLAEQLLKAAKPESDSKTRHMPVLNGVPAYIASKFVRSEIRKFIEEIPGYAEIFGRNNGEEPPLSDRTDAILTGVGLVGEDENDNGTAVFIRERIKQEPELDCKSLKKWIYGDISGWLLARDGINRADANRIKSFNNGWVGITNKTFAACGKRATERDMPGIVVLAKEKEKAELVAHVVSKGWVNNLVIHKNMAEALAEKLRAIPSNR